MARDFEFYLFVHADTVFDAKSPFQHFTLNQDGTSAKGPGIIDDKGGIVVALEGLRRFLSEDDTKYKFRFISSPSEETGSTNVLEKYNSFAGDTWLVLGFEPSLENGSIVESRRGNRWYHIKVHGKEAHSGRAHKDGVNACHELATKITRISALTNYKKDVTVSIGHMNGGQEKYNIVCGQAEAKIDTRFSTPMDRTELISKIDRI